MTPAQLRKAKKRAKKAAYLAGVMVKVNKGQRVSAKQFNQLKQAGMVPKGAKQKGKAVPKVWHNSLRCIVCECVCWRAHALLCVVLCRLAMSGSMPLLKLCEVSQSPTSPSKCLAR